MSRYDVTKVNDGIGGEEGAFSLCTLWTCEALCRAGAYDKKLLTQSMIMLEDFLGYASTLGLFSEEIGKGGQALGNYPQGDYHFIRLYFSDNSSRLLLRQLHICMFQHRQSIRMNS